MKIYLVLFAVFLTAIFLYPVFAHANKIGPYVSPDFISAPVALLMVGAGLLIAAGLTRRAIK